MSWYKNATMSDSKKVNVVGNKGCSRLFAGRSVSQPLKLLRNLEPDSPSTSSTGTARATNSKAPFAGLVICVTGLSKEARKQVMDATELLGGIYSPDLHPRCTHLVVQSFGGRKFDHAIKHGVKNGLFLVTLGWFVDSVRRNVRLSESLYRVKGAGENGVRADLLLQSCITEELIEKTLREQSHDENPKCWLFSGCTFFIDEDIPDGLRKKISEAAGGDGATLLDQWFAGCKASHVVCEGASVPKYLGHCNNIVSPAWVIKSVKEAHLHRLLHISVDLARHAGNLLETHQEAALPKDTKKLIKKSTEERQNTSNLAKIGVRNRRIHRMQPFQTPFRRLTPSRLLDSICWSVSEPPAAAAVFSDSHSQGANQEACFSNLTRPLTDSEKNEVIFKNPFLTILYPVDRFAELGPLTRTYFSENGFAAIDILEHIYAFYQENMPLPEVEVAIHTDSRHADRLRSVYSSKEADENGFVMYKRIELLGSRSCLEALKRISGDGGGNAYELLVRA